MNCVLRGKSRVLAMEGLENINVMLKMCLLELNYLKDNFVVFEEVSSFTLDKIIKNWDPTNNDQATLVEYDNLCTSLSTVTNLARKLNLHFQLQNEKNFTTSYLPEFDNCVSEKHQILVDIGKQSDQIEVNSHNEKPSCDYKSCSVPPVEVTEYQNCQSVEKFYKLINLEKYKPNSQITASITHIQNLQELKFFICESNTEDASKILQIGKMKHLRQNSKIPSKSEIFGLVLDDVIWRAIRCNDSLCVDTIENGCEATLLDIGETVQLDSESIIYTLPAEFQLIPAQAIPCLLMEDAIAGQIELQEQLLKWKYRKVILNVDKNYGSSLGVRIISDNDDALKFMGIGKHNPFKNDKIKTVDKGINIDPNEKNCRNGLTEDELEMLYEEPLGTTNAMKAVMGYDPSDEKRICRFYKSKNKSCFKGANCRQEHTLMLNDGWTKDVLPSNNVFNSMHPTMYYNVDAIISITPTYIGELRQFYCQINDSNYDPLIWTSEEISDLLKLQTAPMIYDIVLAKYKDGMWYRAKVVEMDDAGIQFKVFYIDYGNQETVHLKNLRRCDYNIAACPEQAVLCRISDFEVTPKSNKKQKQAVNMLCETVLNKQLTVKVVFHSDVLMVKIIDESYSYLLNEINKIIF